MAAYYNEIDPFAAAWLRELIKGGHIAEGEVDERSIVDIRPSELRGFTQCHFFAGIGVWSHALRQAGWHDDRPIWTGSCPCQPFSAAGKGAGFDDERHLWPHFHWLIENCRPPIVLGEQVASKDGLAWLDLVQTDLEGSGYTSGAVDTCAAGFGAPHIRQRLYWVGIRGVGLADAYDSRLEGEDARAMGHERAAAERGGWAGGMENTMHTEWRSQHVDGQNGLDWSNSGREEAHGVAGARSQVCGMAHSNDNKPRAGRDCGSEEGERLRPQSGGRRDVDGLANVPGAGWRSKWQNFNAANSNETICGWEAKSRRCRSIDWPSPTNGFWRDPDWLFCRDGKWRPVESSTFPLAPRSPTRVGRLRGYGNAINAAQAQGFIEAVMSVC